MEAPNVPPVISIRPALISHVAKAALSGVPAVAIGWFSYQLAFVDQPTMEPAARFGLAAGLGLLALLFAFAVARNVRAMVVRPEMFLTPDGFRVVSWELSLTDVLRPYYRLIERTVAWGDLVETLVYTRTVNGVTMAQELRVTTKSLGKFAFGRDVFAPSVPRIQRTMLDYIDECFRAPRRAAARLAEFQRRRWAVPLVLPGSKLSLGWIVGAWVLVVGLGYFATFVEYGQEHDWAGFLAFVALVVAGAVTRNWWRASRSRHLELGPNGLAVGPEAARSRAIPWDQIRFVRAHVTHATHGPNSAVDRVEVRLGDGKAVMIDARNQGEYQRILAYLEPPLDNMAEVWAQLDRGVGPEAAAQAGGLMARDPVKKA
jgi:hypothetical protein